jgi:pimeloyl-ACP methyl ester carboxylesterase
MAPLDASTTLLDGPWSHRHVAANGARFHVAEMGDGPLVLLLHGFPEFWWAWRHQLPVLASAGYRAVAMDLRGYGASDKPPRGYDPFTLAGDVTGVIRSLGEPDAAVISHGWGAYLGWTAAVLQPKLVRRLVTVSMPHPNRLRGAVLTDPGQAARMRHIVGFQRPWLPERQLVADDARFVGRLLTSWSGPRGFDDSAADVYRRAARVNGVAHCSLEYYRWMLRSLPRRDGIRFARAMSSPITVPVLQLHGTADGMFLPRTAAGSGRYVEAPYRWRLLDGVGHFPHEEAPETLTDELLTWLADPEPDR